MTQRLRERRRHRIGTATLALLALGLLAAAGALALDNYLKSARLDPTAQAQRRLPPVTGPSPAAGANPLRHGWPRQQPRPKRIEIAAIGVSARVIPLGLNPDRTLEVPQDFDETGWFTGAAEPGERGAAVIVGHVDSESGPAVFYRLRALESGDFIEITLKDGSTVRYVVTSSLAVPKNRFPTARVYTPTRRPTLRLITCDGEFDSATGHYLDNYIVFAKIAA